MIVAVPTCEPLLTSPGPTIVATTGLSDAYIASAVTSRMVPSR